MSKKSQWTDLGNLGISLKDMASILDSDKKLTRGAKNQLKLSVFEKEIGEKQSEVSFDSKKSIETKKDAKKNDKNPKKKQNSLKTQRITLGDYFGVPDLEAYITSEDLTPKSHYSLQKFSIGELGKNHLPSLMRVILKNNMKKDQYEVKRGQLKKQKTTREQFLIDLSYASGPRSEVRSITRDNGFVLVGENLAMLRLKFEDWKELFREQIQGLRKELLKPSDSGQVNEKIEEEKQEKQNIVVQGIQESEATNKHIRMPAVAVNEERMDEEGVQQKMDDKCFRIEQQKSLQFVQIMPNQSLEILSSEEQEKEGLSRREENDSGNNSNSAKPSQKFRQKGRQSLDERELFKKFCITGCDFILWPVLIYETALGDVSEAGEIIANRQYAFTDKAQNIFDMISKSSEGLFQPYSTREIKSQSFLSQPEEDSQDLEKFCATFQKTVLPQISDPILAEEDEKESQINLIVYPFGSGKLMYFETSKQLKQKLIKWNNFSSSFINFYMFQSCFKEVVEEIGQAIDRLNEFARYQVSECKTEEIRNSIDRLVKCSIDGKIYNGITLRYSNIQKKVLALLFGSCKSTANELIWLNVEQIYPNYTLPQLNAKNKFLLYFSNDQSPLQQRSLTQFIHDMYTSFFCKPISNIVFTKNYQNHSDQSSHITSASNLNRCVECFYPIHKLQYSKCRFCENYCHKECSTKAVSKSIELNFEGIANLWTCNTCEPCNLCLQPLGNKRISCMKCSNMFHQVCGKLKMQENTLHRDRYLCQNCIQCKICEKKLKNLDYTLMKEGSYQCINCQKAEQANQICHICKKEGDGRWAQCSREFCGKWIHKNCDKYIQSRNNFFSNNNEEVYFCPFCRRVEKRRLILKFIEILAVFDEYQYFIGSDYEEILDYKYVIANPMCLRKMYERCHEGWYDENSKENLQKDFELIISNALKYNMPKDQPHYQARILNILGSYAIDKFHNILECSEEDLIKGGLPVSLQEKKRELHREIYDRYLEIILNYKSVHSTVEVKKPKEAVSKSDRQSYYQPNDLDHFVFSSRHLLKEVFKSSMLKFKTKKKPPSIQNLFQIQKVIQAYKCPIKQKFCYYHYWNSNVVFYCEICMEHYCCTTKCYKHHVCTYCGVKGCACDLNECGCLPLKEKEKKTYEKLIHEKYYDRRQITENFSLCLRCACEKLNSKICSYCEKAYEFYYDFQTCKECSKVYHKECADVHASQNMSKFFFKKQKQFPNIELFSSNHRLDQFCYECSTSRHNKTLMYEKLKMESLSKLKKLQKLGKLQPLISSIYQQNGIKIHLNDILMLILNNYDEFLQYESLFDEYKTNFPSVRLNSKLSQRTQERIDIFVQEQAFNKVNEAKMIALSKVQLLKKSSFLFGSLCFGCNQEANLFNLIDPCHVWKQKLSLKSKEFIFKNKFLLNLKYQENLRKIRLEHILQKHQKSKASQKTQKIQQQNQKINLINITTLPSSKKNLNNQNGDKIPVWSKSHIQGGNSQKLNSSKTYIPLDDKSFPAEFMSVLFDENCFKTFTEIQIESFQFVRKESAKKCERDTSYGLSLLAEKNSYELNLINIFSIVSPLVYEKSTEKILKEWPQKASQLNSKQQKISYEPNPIQQQHSNSQKQPLKPIDIQAQLQLAVNKMYSDPHYNQDQETDVSIPLMEDKLMKIHLNHTNMSKISKYKRLGTLHSVITKFLLRCFQMNKSVYRRGNTCILKAENTHWRILKKGRDKNDFQEISLKKQSNKWFFSINESTWWIQTIEQIISKLKPLVELSSFRELADFLGFTFKCIPVEKAMHFTRFLQTNPSDDITAPINKTMILELYDKLEWQRSGSFKNKITEPGKEEVKQYITTKRKIFYLAKKKTKNLHNQSDSKPLSQPPYISFEDLKKDLDDTIETKKQDPIILTEPGDNVFIGPSPIHKLGLFAKQHYPKHTTMVEYIGEVLSESMADVRESRFHFGCYMFGLNRRNCDKRQIIDATFRGNMARYLNHSCDANCKARIEMVNGQPSIFIYSIREIAQFQQLTYDYQFSVDGEEKLVCTCGAKNCQGRLN